jgi:hypothetical protein
MPIQASVGKHLHATKQCYNLPNDQLRVANLLDLIGSDQGGTNGALLLNLPQIRWGIVDERLYRAIQVFQTKQFGFSDGHVDPGEKTIRKLEELAFATPPAGKPGQPSVPTSNTPFQPPTDMPNPSMGWLDPASKGVDIASFITGLDAIGFSEFFGLVLLGSILEAISGILGIISAIASLPLAWKAADKLANFNGYCNGYWNAMQDMAEAFKDSDLDSLITVTVTPPESLPVVPAKVPPPTWPQIPTPAPHMSAQDESRLGESERQNRAGERKGCQDARDFIMNLESNPKAMSVQQRGHRYQWTATGKVQLRLMYAASKGRVAASLQDAINKKLKAQGLGEWPLH